MIEACARGAYKPTPIGDNQLQRVKENMLLRAQETEILRQLDSLVYIWHCATAQLVEWDKDAKLFEFNHKKARELYTTIGKDTMPWYDGWLKRNSTLVDLWERFKKMQEDPEEQKFVKQFRSELEKEADRMRTEEEANKEAWATYERIRKRNTKRK